MLMVERQEFLNTSLPFLIYGIYDPYYSQIEDISNIQCITDDDLIEKIVPIKINQYNRRPKRGYLVYFKKECCDDAYDIISKSKYGNNYEWKEKTFGDKSFNIMIKKDRNNYENKFLNLPNTDLPLFAYGVFKKGELGYLRIKDYICREENFDVDYAMGIRDGIPILIENVFKKTDGYLIYFNENDKNEAYRIISNTASSKLYKWKEIDKDGISMNVLMGNNIEKGTSDMYYQRSYEGFDDYFFSDVIKLIEKELNKNKNKFTLKNFFYLQMCYLLLWVAIERFCTLKYGLNEIYINRENFAGEKMVETCLKNIDRDNMSIYSSKDFQIHYLDKEDPYESVEYYYTIRCNVAHRGKRPDFVNRWSYELIYNSLEELLYIFKNVLIDSFDRDIFHQQRGGIL